MIVVTYTAKRNLITGHTAETQYTLRIRGRAKYNPKVINQVTKTEDGTPITQFIREENSYDIDVGPFDTVDILEIREFLSSISRGETFSFQENDDASIESVVLEGGWSESYLNNITNYKKVSFKVRVL